MEGLLSILGIRLMTQPYTLPDPLPGESNADWCRRAAESIPAEV